MMRVLLAYDGSDDADRAVALAESIAWPSETRIRIVSVIEPVVMPLPGLWAQGTVPDLELDAAIAEQVGESSGTVAKRLAGPRHSVESAVLPGRAASVILEEARSFAADLIVVGSRGQGPIATLVLGSVSTEVVDHAPCPVLVARRPTLTGIVFATDESPAARAAESIVATWPIFEERPIRVVSVAHVDHPWTTGIAPTMYQEVLDAYAADVRESKASHQRAADDAVERLRAAGRLAEPEMQHGDPAAMIIAVARERTADLVVLGSRGRTGLARIVLGSVARNVLSGSEASVLIVHDQAVGAA